MRGGTFDFITTSPPAVIAKAIVWIGVENLQTAKILDEINKYLQGLNNIVMDDQGGNFKENFCTSPSYGHFVVVINKMMGTATDQQLQTELMAPEPDYIDGALERNKIRQQLLECFDGVSVHGLPTLTNIPPGESIDYPYLDGRFKDGLGHIANSVLERVGTPRTVTVTGVSRELNASNAEVIIATVIEEANKGQIDLTGFESFWTYTKQDIIVKLGRAAQGFDKVSDNCEQQSPELGYTCSPCVCSYRKSSVEATLVTIDSQLDLAKTQAETLFGINIDQQIGEFYDDTILPWEAEQTCSNSVRRQRKTAETTCDISEMESSMIQPGQEVEVACELLFICGSIVMDAKQVHLTATSIFVSSDATIKTSDLPKASDGQNGAVAGADGGDGGDGAAAGSIIITANEKLAGSANTLIFQSKGGAGGDGGNGSPGADITSNVPAGPSTAEEVCAQGVQYDYSHTQEKHCGHHCTTDDEYWYFRVTLNYDACGGDGGRGGKGGDGGAAGQLTILGSSGVTATNNLLESAGGLGGTGGAGAAGIDVDREYLGWHRHWESPGCHGFGGLSCGPSYHDAWGGYQVNGYPDTPCSGGSGESGFPGAPWVP